MTNPPPDAVILTPRRGNPDARNARGKFASLKRAFRERITDADLDAIIDNMREIAIGGTDEAGRQRYEASDSVRAAEFLFDRMYGKTPINLNVNRNNKAKIQINLVNFRDEFMAEITRRTSGGLPGVDGSQEPVHSSRSDDAAGQISGPSD